VKLEVFVSRFNVADEAPVAGHLAGRVCHQQQGQHRKREERRLTVEHMARSDLSECPPQP
jgi:hypothetical protein